MTEVARCAWCGRRFERRAGQPGRPRLFCRRSCRQRQYEARIRQRELGLTEGELIVARTELDRLNDDLYVLEAAVEDVRRDLDASPTVQDYRDAVAWLIRAAEPLIQRRLGDSG